MAVGWRREALRRRSVCRLLLKPPLGFGGRLAHTAPIRGSPSETLGGLYAWEVTPSREVDCKCNVSTWRGEQSACKLRRPGTASLFPPPAPPQCRSGLLGEPQEGRWALLVPREGCTQERLISRGVSLRGLWAYGVHTPLNLFAPILADGGVHPVSPACFIIKVHVNFVCIPVLKVTFF